MSEEIPNLTKFVFPQDETNQYFPDKFQRHGGLEVRDYLAAQALPMMITISAGKNVEDAMEKAAVLAYKSADAMMKVRGHAEQTSS